MKALIFTNGIDTDVYTYDAIQMTVAHDGQLAIILTKGSEKEMIPSIHYKGYSLIIGNVL